MLVQDITGFAMFGVIWIVQLVVYPAFNHIRPDDFPERHKNHVHRISPVVIPLMLAELISCLWLLFLPGEASPLQPAISICAATAWLSTFLIQVPLHRRMENTFDIRLIQKLIATNWIRTAAWSAKAVLLIASR